MPIVNLKKYYYPLIKENTFIEVSDEVAEGLLELHRYEDRARHKRYYHNAYYTLDAKDGIENCALDWKQPSPEELMLEKEEEEYQALMLKRMQDSFAVLTPTQAKRMRARYFDKRKLNDIAADDGVHKACVHESLKDGLEKLKKHFDKNEWTLRVQ